VPSTIAGEMSFRSRAILAGIYGEQDRLNSLHYSVLPILLTPNAGREQPAFVRDQIWVIRNYLEDVVGAEQRLLAGYHEAIRDMGSS
jgi:hypothetical protein